MEICRGSEGVLLISRFSFWSCWFYLLRRRGGGLGTVEGLRASGLTPYKAKVFRAEMPNAPRLKRKK